MSDQDFLRGSCHHCAGHIEFPAEGAGLTVDCPHCGEQTVLGTDSSQVTLESPALTIEGITAPAKSRSGSPVALIATVVVIVLLVGITTAGFLFYANQPKGGKMIQSTPRVEPPTVPTRTEEQPARLPTEQAAQSEPVTAATAPKSLDHLKVGVITLEKAKGTGLVYAIGTLTNASEHQRFGVKIELDLLDAKGEKIGVAKDYRSTLEPRQEWRFRALVLDNRAVSARVASLEEDQ